MAIASHSEVERKFDVGEEVAVPSLRAIPGVASVSDPEVHDLDAVYYDTADLSLARAGITLRRRSGGTDAGWHLKLPVGEHERKELRLPAGEAPDEDLEVPEQLLQTTRAVRRGGPLGQVARIRTRREVRRLLDDERRVLAEFCDDHVRADRLPRGARSSWREWEVELVDGSERLLGQAAELLLTSGARPATVGSKLARALGRQVGERPLAASTAGMTMWAYLAAQLEQLRREDPLVRADAPDSVHKMRVAARRARSALATYSPVLEPASGDALSTELRWLGTVLGEARDAEVLRARLDALMTELPDAELHHGLTRWLDSELDHRRERGLSNAEHLLRSERYARLPVLFEDFLGNPPFAPGAARPAPDEVARLVARDWKRLDRRARLAAAAADRPERDRALHDVRKAAKRLRYAAESAVPVLGAHAQGLAGHCATIQDLLGEHHDSTVARELLQQLRRGAELATGSDHVLERLQAREEELAEEVERDYEAALAQLRRPHPRRWLRDAPAT